MIVFRKVGFPRGERLLPAALAWSLLSAGLMIGADLTSGPQRCAAQDDHYPALGFSLPASSARASSRGSLPALAQPAAAEPTTIRSGKLRGAQVAAAETSLEPAAGSPLPRVQTASHLLVETPQRIAAAPQAVAMDPPPALFPHAASQSFTAKSPADASFRPYVPDRQTTVVPQPATPPPDFTGSRPPVGTSPPGLWLVSQFLGERPDPSASPPADLAAPAPPPDDNVDHRPSIHPSSSQRPSPHRLASHQQPSAQQPDRVPAPPPIEPVPTQEPMVVPAAPLAGAEAARVEIVAGSPPATAYQPVLWPTYLECRLLPSCPPECQPICRPGRPPLPACGPCW